MSKVLVVEDSRSLSAIMKSRLSEEGFDVTVAGTLKDAISVLDSERTTFLAAVLDLTLPDASGTEIVTAVRQYSVPSFVFTRDFDSALQNTLWKMGIVDYVFKEGRHSIEYIVRMLNRLELNTNTSVLVADDSRSMRNHFESLLQTHRYKTILVENGQMALEVLKSRSDISLLITDYNMPGMNGVELIRNARQYHSPDRLAIIGISDTRSANLSSQFIKHGANDFLPKPFLTEEFYCRVTQNIELIDKIEKIRNLSQRDFLTGLYNRRFFFGMIDQLLLGFQKDETKFFVAMMDIDFFKKVNDTYGHDGGDEVLRTVSDILKNIFDAPDDLVARFGGEEFCVVSAGKRFDRLEILRSSVEGAAVQFKNDTIRCTISIGVSDTPGSIGTMLAEADEHLYQAKNHGRNRICTGVSPT